jgi:hypothetical protein
LNLVLKDTETIKCNNDLKTNESIEESKDNEQTIESLDNSLIKKQIIIKIIYNDYLLYLKHIIFYKAKC